MLTPCVKPVTAGKNSAKTAQNGRSPEPCQLAARVSPSKLCTAPTANTIRASPSMAMITNCSREAQSVPSQASTSNGAIARPATSRGDSQSTATNAVTPSAKPMA